MQRCVAEADVYALASHQYWGTWSLLQVGACRLGLPKVAPLSRAGQSECERGVSAESRLHLRAAAQAKWSKIDFDYLSYARLRWDEYFRRKDEFLAAAAATFASP